MVGGLLSDVAALDAKLGGPPAAGAAAAGAPTSEKKTVTLTRRRSRADTDLVSELQGSTDSPDGRISRATSQSAGPRSRAGSIAQVLLTVKDSAVGPTTP